MPALRPAERAGVLGNTVKDGTGTWYALLTDSNGQLSVALASGGTTQYTEDVASAGGESLTLAGAVRRDTAASSSTTDGDYSTINTDATGRLWTHVGLVDAIVPGTAATNLGKAEDGASADGDTGVGVLAVRKATPTNTSGTDGDYEFLQMSAGRLWASSTVYGDVAAAATDSGNPLKIGGVGHTANPTAVTDGQRVDAIFDKLGKQVVVGAIRDLKGIQKTTITSSAAETTILTAVASTFLDVYGLIIANTSATAASVTIKDATSGTTRFIIYVPAGDTRGFMLPVDSAVPQSAVNNNWTATGTSVASLEYTVLFVKNI